MPVVPPDALPPIAPPLPPAVAPPLPPAVAPPLPETVPPVPLPWTGSPPAGDEQPAGATIPRAPANTHVSARQRGIERRAGRSRDPFNRRARCPCRSLQFRKPRASL